MSDPKSTLPPSGKPYPETSPRPDFPALEKEILEFWNCEEIFEASLASREGEKEYIFYDGPPFANGMPHYGHILTGYVKDVVPRYQTMRGRWVPRRFGWDCHGLPAELEAEKVLGISGSQQIRELGIGKFNQTCHEVIGTTVDAWRDIVDRQARWVDMENDYKTLDLDYMESVMWGFKTLYDKGLVYEGFRVVAWCHSCQTALSNFETRLDDATRPRQDPSITVLFDLVEEFDGKPTRILAWTTTPWTLPSNLALAVGPDITYSLFEEDGAHYILAKSREEVYAKQLKDATRIRDVTARELAGREYRPLFPYFAGHENAFRVLEADFVTTEDGSGIVHCAPGFGEVDQELCNEKGIATVAPVDDRGCFHDVIEDWAGENVFEANKAIAKHLRAAQRVVRHDTIEHNYPHCWRCDTPLIYRAVSAWYLRVTEIRERMLANNQQINWIPQHVKEGAFGKWLEGARDWCLSRNRFFGSAIPIWRWSETGEVEVFGSLDELEERFDKRLDDLHRPMIDELVLTDPEKGELRRIPDVIDCWFESGSMPWAQVHYPFENKERFEKTFPADFIVEYIAQTRGWFYTLMVLSTGLFDKPPFLNCVCHGVVLDEEGRKLSKRLRNYPDPIDVFDNIGSDALRWYLLGNPILRGQNMRVDKEGKGIQEVARMGLIPLWNCFHFFCMYANAEGVKVSEEDWEERPENPLDRYILTKLHHLVRDLTDLADHYDIPACYGRIGALTEDLSNWYIRRSRSRFYFTKTGAKSEAARADGLAALRTLHRVLTTTARALAPFLPFLAEVMYKSLTDGRSVHLGDWPDAAYIPTDREVEARMDLAREISSLGRALREEAGVRVRLPLPEVRVACARPELLEGIEELVRDELNVKRVSRVDDPTEIGEKCLSVHLKKVGPRFGKDTKKVVAAANQGDWELLEDGRARVGEHELDAELFEVQVQGKHGEPVAAGREGSLLVTLDTAVTPELEREGLARDLIRVIQDARKDADLDVTDRIRLRVRLPEPLRDVVVTHIERLRQETLCEDLALVDDLAGTPVEFELGDGKGALELERV